MHFPKLKWVILLGAVLGIVVPLAFLIIAKHYQHLATGRDLLIWPSAIMLIATENHGHDFFALSVLASSILANVLYYSLIAVLLWCIVRAFTAAIVWIRTR